MGINTFIYFRCYKYSLSKLLYLTTATLLNIYTDIHINICTVYYKIIIMQVHRLILKLNRFLF